MAFLTLGTLDVEVSEFRRLPDERGGGGLRRTVNGHLRGRADWVKRGWSGELYAADDAELGAVLMRLNPDREVVASGDALAEGDYVHDAFTEVPSRILPSTAGVSVQQVEGAEGGAALQFSGVYRQWYPDLTRRVAFNPDTLYRMQVRVRVTTNSAGAQNERLYAGVHALTADGDRITVPSASVNRYITMNAVRPVVADGWQTYTGWLRGIGSHSTSTSQGSPAGLQGAEDAIWISPLLGIHWDAGGTEQVTQVDFVTLAAYHPATAALGVTVRAEQAGDVQFVRTGARWLYRVPVTLREV